MTIAGRTVIAITAGRQDICRTILTALPDWFGIPEALDQYCWAADHQIMFAVQHEGRAVGMLCLAEHSHMNAEIAVMGVLPNHHRQGIGAALIAHAEGYARSQGTRMLSVKTLADRHPDPAYAGTRAFYRRMGFHLFEELPTLWGAATPCAIFVKPLGAPSPE